MNQESKKLTIAEREEKTLKFWSENGIFEKTLEKTKGKKTFVFYDGPPFATGAPHYGHLLTSFMKDVIPRYRTMKGNFVRRVWGWDCHGLPLENVVEKELGLEHKKDIEKFGIEKFNETAKVSVLRYDADWKKMIPRIGRWVDMEHSYKTMDASYSESIWWAFKTLYDKKLIYKGFKSMHMCPRCETTLSNNEVADGYKDITDISITVKFELVDEPGTYVLAWTTTPWTLPGNVALAVGEEIEYVRVRVSSKNKKVFLISGKHAWASMNYFPSLKKRLEKEGYNVTIIDHKDSKNPQLDENMTYLKAFDFSGAHVVTHSLGASTFLKFLDENNTFIETLTMIAPSYPGKSFSSTNPKWIKKSGYIGFDVNFESIKKKITRAIDIVYSVDDEIIRIQNFELLGERLCANMHREDNKKHFFAKEYTNEPNFVVNLGEYYILAKNRVADVLNSEAYEIIEEFAGNKLIGKSYKPLFDYYANDPKLPNRENGWKIYPASFVTTESGTGVVHIAPAFGEDDLKLGEKYDLPFVQHVRMDGTFAPEVKDFAGMPVKPKSDDEKTRLSADIAVIKYLQEHNTFFNKEKIVHSYGRFGKWLHGARDWAISRSRFWGAPLPVWECSSCKKIHVVGSIQELQDNMEVPGNRYILMRHAQAENNVHAVVSNDPRNGSRLTEEGKKQAIKTGKGLRNKKINTIYSSDFYRARETAEI
ncbi:MAG: Isoleucine-tRNA ligase, partial [Candidatus Pacebacteria bacterium GW2011_GWA1_46_10]